MARREISISGQDSSYRRGLILGLTMAEILILTLFVLMLLLAALRFEGNDALKRVTQDKERIEQELIRAQAMIDTYASAANGRGIVEIIAEFVRLKAEVNKVPILESEIAGLEAANTALAEKLETIMQTLKSVGLDSNNMVAVQAQLELQRELLDTLVSAGQDLDPEALEDTLEDYARLIEEQNDVDGIEQSVGNLRKNLDAQMRRNKDLEGQVANLQTRLGAAGKGTDNPPCWATPEGKVQYIYDIAATSLGMRVRIHPVPEREMDRKDLPTDAIILNAEVSPETFRAMTADLYQWAEEKKCSWWAVVYDHTPATEKALWVKREHQIGERFYRYLKRDLDDWPLN